MNFVYAPKIAAEIDGYVNYICPVLGADKVLEKTDPSVAKNPLIFPTTAMLKHLHQFDTMALFNLEYKQKWQKLIGALDPRPFFRKALSSICTLLAPVAPGAWPCPYRVFFVVPMYYLGEDVARDTGPSFPCSELVQLGVGQL